MQLGLGHGLSISSVLGIKVNTTAGNTTTGNTTTGLVVLPHQIRVMKLLCNPQGLIRTLLLIQEEEID